MLKFFKVDNWIDVLKHLAIIGIIGISAIAFFFYIYLPVSTNHGDTITVPDVIGVSYDQLDQYLTERNLRYEITEDSSYSSEHPPLSVLKQFPLPNAKVKENRKIYLTLNSTSPPLVRMPDLTKGSLKNAQMVLQTYDLILGERNYVADLAFNAVLEQKINGREVMEGEQIPKGSVIDLVLGDGLGNQSLESPNLIGLNGDIAQLTITGSALKVGKVRYDQNNVGVIMEEGENGEMVEVRIEVSAGEVYQQSPTPGNPMRIKQEVDIWIYRPDSLATSQSILDQ